MSLRCRAWFVAFIATAVAGCASTPTGRQAFNVEAHRDVRKVVILEPAPLEKYNVNPGLALLLTNESSSSGLGFPLLVPFIAIAVLDQVSKSDQFTEKARTARLDINDALVAVLATQLSAAGFQVTRHKMDRPSAAWAEDYKPWSGTADAVLDVQVLAAGFGAIDPTALYTPMVSVSARLVDTRSHAIYYREVHESGSAERIGKVASRRELLTSFHALMQNSDVAFEELLSAARTLAEQIVVDLTLL